MRHARKAMVVALASSALTGTVEAAELGGSMSSMRRQHGVAIEHDYTFLRTAGQVQDYVAKGRLEHLAGDGNYVLHKVSFPYARNEVRLFVERLARDFRAATGQTLVVTSLTRPDGLQPRNAHELSVHPAGMAVDFRVPADSAGRRWLERTLLALEKQGLIDATRERYPPHYHVAVFRDAFLAYEEKRAAEDAAAAMKALSLATVLPIASAPAPSQTHMLMSINPVVGGIVTGLAVLAVLALSAGVAGRRAEARVRSASTSRRGGRRPE